MEASQRESKQLGSSVKNQIAQFMLQRTQAGILPHGMQKMIAAHFGVDRKTCYRIWKEGQEQIRRGEPVAMRDKVRGYSHCDKLKLDVNKVRNLSVLERSSIRKMALKLEVSKSTLGQWVKEKQIRPHTNAFKPALTEVNKLTRLRWSLSQLQPRSENGKITFQTMHNVVHIDEKWFYITKASDKYYLLPDEDEPYRSCRSKRFRTKIMFMCVVCRPHFAQDGHTLFDGKIGIFPFTTLEPAQRRSKNRAKGTLETKPIASVTKSVMKDCILQKVIPAIKAKWPEYASKEIFIQQDNAKPHINPKDPDFVAAANSDGFKIRMTCQPPNSPDTNVLDLGFFRAIQSLQDDKLAKGVDDLLRNVCSSFEELSSHTLNKVFLTLQGCLEQILTVKGGNNYKVPHMNKERMQREDNLPVTLQIDEQLVRDTLEFLQLPQNNAGSAYDIAALTNALGY